MRNALIGVVFTIGIVLLCDVGFLVWRKTRPPAAKSNSGNPPAASLNTTVAGALPPAPAVHRDEPTEWTPITGRPFDPTPPAPGPEEISMPQDVDDAMPGGAGRYLVISSKAANLVAVFDASQRKIVKTITPSTKDFAVAAGAEKFFIATSRPASLERWDFATLAMDRSVTLDARGVGTMAMGSDSDGPLMIVSEKDGSPHWQLFDVETLAPLKNLRMEDPRWPVDRSTDHLRWNGVSLTDLRARVRMSADGGVVALTFPGWSTSGLYVMDIHGDILVDRHEHDHAGRYFTPTDDGAWLCATRGIYTRVFRPLDGDRSHGGTMLDGDKTVPSGNGFQNTRFIPAGRGGLFIEARVNTAPTAPLPPYVQNGSRRSRRGQQEDLPPIIEHLPDGRTIVRTRLPNQPPPPPPVPTPPPNYSGNPTMPASTLSLSLCRDWTEAGHIAEFPPTPELTVPDAWRDLTLPFDRCVQLMPDHHVLVTIPPGGKKLVVRGFDVRRASLPAPPGPNSLVVTTSPPRVANKGQTWTYQPDLAFVQSGSFPEARVEYGPTGLALGGDGKFTWSVPTDFPEDRVGVVLSFRGGAGSEISQSFVIHIREAGK